VSVCVLDASLALELVFPAATSDTRHAAGLLRQSGALVPEIWHWETVNAVLRAERRREIRAAHVQNALDTLVSFVSRTELMSAEDAILSVRGLARAERISLFDAAYLDLAERTGLPLATLDGGLAAAAARRNIALVPLIP
jgi:predicted nucleic acid-binding protein